MEEELPDLKIKSDSVLGVELRKIIVILVLLA
jgi:hypothetical protein